MANNHSALTGLFTDIADAIRVKTGGTESIVADEFPEAIAAIDTQEDLDPELATQDNLIAQLTSALQGKAGASGGSVETVAGNVSYLSGSGMYGIYYEDGSGVIHAEGAVGSGLDDYVDIPETIEVRKGSLLTLWSNEVIDGGAYNGVLYDTCFNNKTGIELVSQYLNSATVGLAILKITDNFTIDFLVEDPF